MTIEERAPHPPTGHELPGSAVEGRSPELVDPFAPDR
jgi:hypothetical protein